MGLIFIPLKGVAAEGTLRGPQEACWPERALCHLFLSASVAHHGERVANNRGPPATTPQHRHCLSGTQCQPNKQLCPEKKHTLYKAVNRVCWWGGTQRNSRCAEPKFSMELAQKRELQQDKQNLTRTKIGMRLFAFNHLEKVTMMQYYKSSVN